MPQPMGFDFGLEKHDTCYKRKYRWLFRIPTISGDKNSVYSLPPTKAARPSISFKEIEAQGLNETIILPGKPEWKPITLTLYDLVSRSRSPVFRWLERMYPVNSESWNFPIIAGDAAGVSSFKIPKAYLDLYNGCGDTIESWVFEGVWPQTIDFGDLDMSSSEVCMCDITLRYDRAYIIGFDFS